MRPLKIEPYFTDYVHRHLEEIAACSSLIECVRTDHLPARTDPRDPERTIGARQLGIVEFDHGRQCALSLWKSKAPDQAKKLAQILKNDEDVEKIRSALSLIAGCNPIGSWPINSVGPAEPRVVTPDQAPGLVSPSTSDYLADSFDDLREMLPRVNRIEIRYAITHASNHVQRTRPFYVFHSRAREIAAIENNQLVMLLRHEMGAPRTADYYDQNEFRIGVYCEQLQIKREDFVPLCHLLPLFGANYQATLLDLHPRKAGAEEQPDSAAA